MSSSNNSNNATPARSGASSPTITPLHDPAHQAQVIKPAPLGTSQHGNKIVPGQDTTGSAGPGLGVKALLAKKMAKANKPTISPTDQLQSPCTAKLNSAKQKKFSKGTKPTMSKSLLVPRENSDPNANPFQ